MIHSLNFNSNLLTFDFEDESSITKTFFQPKLFSIRDYDVVKHDLAVFIIHLNSFGIVCAELINLRFPRLSLS